MTCVGVVGYKKTVKGAVKLGVVWAKHLNQEFIRRYVKSHKQERIKIAFKAYIDKAQKDNQFIFNKLAKFKNEADFIRIIAHTNMRKNNHEGDTEK